MEKKIIKSVYLIQSIEDGYYKIGVSKQPSRRLSALQTGNSSELKLVESYQSEYAHRIEKTFHNRLCFLKREGEWFELSLQDELSFIRKCEEIEKTLKFLKDNGNVFI